MNFVTLNGVLFISDSLREVIASVVNAIFRIRNPEIWGNGTTTCASDSKKFGAWDQNLMTEWHVRYGGRGVMIYWHVEKKSTCIYSQLKTCSSSEVAAMIEGVLRHDTEMSVKQQFVDTHGQSEVAFAFCHLLGFELMPRLKNIGKQKLYRPEAGDKESYENLLPVLTRPINWDLIRQQYEQMVKYATALRLGIAEPEAILRRFTRANVKHPTYQALGELGKVIKTIFLCRYLEKEELRQEINAGLNVVENWNSTNGFIFYGKSGEISTNQPSEQLLAVLSLHLLQVCLIYINTLMIQEVLTSSSWNNQLNQNDQRALTPLIYNHINPYGTFHLNTHPAIEAQGGGEGGMKKQRTSAKVKAREIAKLLKNEHPDYNYLKSVFRHLRTELNIEVTYSEKKLPKVPTEEELHKYYQAVWKTRNVQDMVIIKTFLYTGVRVSELVNIRLEDVDFDRCQIRINSGKGGKDRIVPFPISFKEVLAMHVDKMEGKRANYLFESNRHQKYSDRGIRKILKKYADKAELDHSISPHQLRHFLLTWLKKQGIDDALIQPYSGHSSRQSLEVYSRLSLNEAQSAYDNVMPKFPL